MKRVFIVSCVLFLTLFLAACTQETAKPSYTKICLPEVATKWDNAEICYHSDPLVILTLGCNNGRQIGPLTDTKKVLLYDFREQQVLLEHDITCQSYIMTAVPYSDGILYVEYDGIFESVNWRLIYADDGSTRVLATGQTTSYERTPTLFMLDNKPAYLWENCEDPYRHGISILTDFQSLVIYENSEAQPSNMLIRCNGSTFCYTQTTGSSFATMITGDASGNIQKFPLDAKLTSFGLTDDSIVCGLANDETNGVQFSLCIIPLSGKENAQYAVQMPLYRIACSGNTSLCVDNNFETYIIDLQTGKLSFLTRPEGYQAETHAVLFLPTHTNSFIVHFSPSDYYLLAFN